MAFIREGRNMEYEEVLNLIVETISNDILEELDVQELKDFLKRLIGWYDTQIRSWVNDIKISGVVGENKVIEKGKVLLEEGQQDKESLIRFISDELVIQMEKSLEMITGHSEVLGQ